MISTSENRIIMKVRVNRILSVLLILSLVIAMMPPIADAASKTSSVKTYVFFGSDSRKADNSWESPNGGKITKDKSGTQGTPRSDVIMLLKVDNKKKTVEVMSIYRDTLLDVSGKGTDFQKANKAYSDLGPKKAVKALEKNLNIKIDGYIATNFKGVAEVIDKLGGVTINIEKDKLDKKYRTSTMKNVPEVMNRYIDETNRIYGDKVAHIKKTGKQKLNGSQAVAYARVRYTNGWDMRRSVRQRTVLSAMTKKYKKASAKKKAAVLKTVLENVDTNIKISESKKVFKKAGKYKFGSMKGFPYYKAFYSMKTKKEIGGISSVTVPADLTTNVIKLHKSFYGQKKYKVSKTVKSYSKKMVKKTKKTYKKRSKKYDNKY